ncbi:MAG TPA: thiamine pyrophosphate-binding protein [Thermoanaerobaculia bacterium]
MSRTRSGAWLVRYALEQLPVSLTFGIPGVHNTEIYDELSRSERIRPILVTHEAGAAFMADAVSRTSGGRIGVLVIVPAAGLTHAMSGIGEAFLDGIPMLVISGGTRTDVPFSYQLHELDQHRILAGLTKKSWKVTEHRDIVPTIFEAYRTAVSGCPGPVFVEVPVNVQLFQGETGVLPPFEEPAPTFLPTPSLVDEAVSLLASASSPGLFVGWGAVDAVAETARIAEFLGAPVSTTLQGLSAFPGNHPLFAGMGFSRAAVPAAERAFRSCDCLLAVGTRFGEIPTGSFGARVPENLVHVDIDGAVLGRNYPAKVAIQGDAGPVLRAIRERLEATGQPNSDRATDVAVQLATDRAAYRAEWLNHQTDRVNPALFFDELRRQLADDGLLVVDDGNHTFLAAELWETRRARTFISPTDFNCMGYCVPATIGAKLAAPGRQVAGIVGDGAVLMTGLELLTATVENAGVAIFVFHDGELSQISQGQEIPYNRKTCTILGEVRLDGIALATGSRFLSIQRNGEIHDGIREALDTAARGQPVVVDVRIDYSKRTRFTAGVVQTVLKRFPLGDKVRFVGRALVRKLTG